MWKGGGAGYHNVVMVTLGTGVGGGIIVNGKIVTGTHGAGGEIGHVHVEDDEHDVTISLGDAMRPGSTYDATDAGQIAELIEIGAVWSSTPALPALSVWQTVCWLPPINPPY